MKKALVLGAGGFIGSHMVKRLKAEGYFVKGVDLKYPEFEETAADEFSIMDLRESISVGLIFDRQWDEVYQYAADMGGAGFIFTGENDAAIMHNSALINLHIADACAKIKNVKVFYSSSACIYPQHIQEEENNPGLKESDAYPANPDSEYGYEKIFSERLYMAYHKNLGLDVRIARFHNIFGPKGTYVGGREKAPAAICRKVAESDTEIEIWGDGNQTRSFLYIDECIEATRRLMQSGFIGPVNIGSDEMVSINQLAEMVMSISGKKLAVKHIDGPQGVRGRNSNNELIYEKLGWRPTAKLYDGLAKTYSWVESMVKNK